MVIIRAAIFSKYPGIAFGFSTKISAKTIPPFFFNMSKSVGDNPDSVERNRTEFFDCIYNSPKKIQFQKQVHGDEIHVITKLGDAKESDAMITSEKGICLAISTADCNAIFLYDSNKQLIAGIHAGWRGTMKQILYKTLGVMKEEFNSRAEDIVAYMAPSISALNYEVGSEVVECFDNKYIVNTNGKFYLDLVRDNFDQLLRAGVHEKKIQVSRLCSFDNNTLLHSYRRDGIKSGRSLGVICLRN
ncbi:MAG: peptidoglycan editing factor PgeF [Ignavibacteriales bacterium]|nr:peptidoglycan editing factor PgeF [Ignavibacteriales bacterium]HOJ17398.1 peptidoglycan editing factor PgeF [Ignavibacteriaceae bacterium]HPO56396.1 peptidoglycan editing factor PgeF [Ignavibacteriaceae bacterium]